MLIVICINTIIRIKQANVLAGMEKQTRNFSEHALKSTAELVYFNI